MINDVIEKCENEERISALNLIKDSIIKFIEMDPYKIDFKIINGRNVKTIGYDSINNICVIQYNHIHNGQSIYYYGVKREQFDELLKTDDICKFAETVFEYHP